jgi:hypothetical protein
MMKNSKYRWVLIHILIFVVVSIVAALCSYNVQKPFRYFYWETLMDSEVISLYLYFIVAFFVVRLNPIPLFQSIYYFYSDFLTNKHTRTVILKGVIFGLHIGAWCLVYWITAWFISSIGSMSYYWPEKVMPYEFDKLVIRFCTEPHLWICLLTCLAIIIILPCILHRFSNIFYIIPANAFIIASIWFGYLQLVDIYGPNGFFRELRTSNFKAVKFVKLRYKNHEVLVYEPQQLHSLFNIELGETRSMLVLGCFSGSDLTAEFFMKNGNQYQFDIASFVTAVSIFDLNVETKASPVEKLLNFIKNNSPDKDTSDICMESFYNRQCN